MPQGAPVSKPPGSPVWKQAVFWFVIALGVGYGSVYNMLPASFPAFSREFGASLAQMGQVQFLFFLSALGFSLVGGSVIAVMGLKKSAIGAFVCGSASLLLISLAHQFSFVLIGSAVFGFSVAAMVVISSSIVAGHFGERRQSVFFLTGLSDASGSLIGPAAVGWWLVKSDQLQMSWRVAYFVAVSVLALLIVWALFMRSGQMDGQRSGQDSKKGAFSDTRGVLASAALYIAVVLGFCHGLAQAGMLSFVGQLFIYKRHIDAAQAAYFLSVNAAGILGGRLTFSWITSHWKIPELVVITVCAVAETGAFLGCIVAPSYASGLFFFMVAGVFVSAIGPSLNSYLGGKFAGRAAAAFSLFAGLSNVGAASGPFLIGTIGSHFGVGRGILFAPVFSAVLSGIALVWFVREKTASGGNRMRSQALSVP